MADAIDKRVMLIVTSMSESVRCAWEERAAIRTFDAQMPTEQAEIEALLDVLEDQIRKRVLTFEIEQCGQGTDWLLVTQRAIANGLSLPSEAMRSTNLADLLDEQFGGVAILANAQF